MKRLALVALTLLCASSAFSGDIYDIQTGVYAELDQVSVAGGVVTAVRYNGFFMGEIPNGPYTGIWVYDGGATAVAEGDIVDVVGLYKEYYELTEIDVAADTLGTVAVTGFTDCYVPLCVTIEMLNADPEAYESVWVNVTDGMMVSEIGSYGQWTVESHNTPGEFMILDDYWYDDTTVVLGECYNCATGIYFYSYSEWKLEPFVDGLTHVDCTIANEPMSFGEVKSLYR